MALNFDKINEEVVGYSICESAVDGTERLSMLLFHDFVKKDYPAVYAEKSYRHAYQSLEQVLYKASQKQDSEIMEGTTRISRMDLLATEAFKREALLNSMNLIMENYLSGRRGKSR